MRKAHFWRDEKMKTGEIVVKYFVTHTYYQILLQWHNQATWEKIRKDTSGIFFCDAATQHWSWPPQSWGFLDHAEGCTTVGRTLLDEWSARRRDPYLTAHNTHSRQTSMPLVGFESTILAGERPQTYAIDRATTLLENMKKINTKF
jgi:hypothetical protein